jgi:ribonuclease HI
MIIYTDGSCKGNGFKGAFGGYALYCVASKTVIFRKLEDRYIPATNQRAEGYAILRAFELLDKKKELIIYTDSKFWKTMIESYIPGWIKKKVDFTTKKNPDLTVRMAEMLDRFKLNNVKLTLHHVKAHKDNKLNNLVDKYAKKAASLPNYKERVEVLKSV